MQSCSERIGQIVANADEAAKFERPHCGESFVQGQQRWEEMVDALGLEPRTR